MTGRIAVINLSWDPLMTPERARREEEIKEDVKERRRDDGD